ncbi:hypothetical protein QEN19_002399 [Hanseniaspora menglaensis]
MELQELKATTSLGQEKSNVISINNLMNPVDIDSKDKSEFYKNKDKKGKHCQRGRPRNRIILSCFKCRSLRQKCDRNKPSCSRCVATKYAHCEYMEDFDPSITYQQHLERLGLKDKRVKQSFPKEESDEKTMQHDFEMDQSLPNHEKDDSFVSDLKDNESNRVFNDSNIKTKIPNLSSSTSPQGSLETEKTEGEEVEEIESIKSSQNGYQEFCEKLNFVKPNKKLRFLLPEHDKKNENSKCHKLKMKSKLKMKCHKHNIEKRIHAALENSRDVNSLDISEQVDRLLLKSAVDLHRANSKNSKASYISILDSVNMPQQELVKSKNHPAVSFFDSLFSSDTTVKNKLFVKPREAGQPKKFELSTQTALAQQQLFTRIFSSSVKNIWKVVALEFLGSLDFNKFNRLQFLIKANKNFLQSWKGNNENVFEQLLEAIPKKFKDFSTIVYSFFSSNLHKFFGFINETKLREKIKEIFITDAKGNITNIFLNEQYDQYYLGILILMFRMCVDPEEYHHPVFDKVTQIVTNFYMDIYSKAHLRAQFLLLVFFKCELQYRETFCVNNKLVDDLLGCAYAIDLPKLITINQGNEDRSILENLWYWVLFIDILAFLELGTPLRFKHNSFDENLLLTNERGRIPLLKKFLFLTRKIFTALEHPFQDPDIDCIFEKINEFCNNYLAPLNYYMNLNSSNDVDPFDFLILTTFMDIKLTLLAYRLALTDLPEEKQALKNKLLGLCITSRMISYTQNYCMLKKVKNIHASNKTDFSAALSSLKKHEKLEENKLRPSWNPNFMCPTFGFSYAGFLNDKTITIMTVLIIEDIQQFLECGNKVTSISSNSQDFKALDALSKQLVDYAVFNGENVTLNYSFYDIMLLTNYWVRKCEQQFIMIPHRVSFPIIFPEIMAYKLEKTIELMFQDSTKFNSFDDFLIQFEKFKLIKAQDLTKERQEDSTDSESGAETDNTEIVSVGKQSSMQLTPGAQSNNQFFNFPDLTLDLESVELSDLMKLLI